MARLWVAVATATGAATGTATLLPRMETTESEVIQPTAAAAAALTKSVAECSRRKIDSPITKPASVATMAWVTPTGPADSTGEASNAALETLTTGIDSMPNTDNVA